MYAVKGEFDRGIALLEQALPLIAEGEVPIYFPRVASSLGLAYMHTGRLGDALEILERAMVHGEGLGFMFGHALVEACLAEALLHAGQVEAASRLADQALERTRRQGEHGWQAWRSEEHTSALQSQSNLVCRLLLEKKKRISACLTI